MDSLQEQLLQQKNAALEKKLAEQTSELQQKNRELEIEAALERVRSRAMSMQNSDELKELIGTVFTELTKLDLVLTRCVIMIYDPAIKSSTWWMANSEAPSDPIGLFVQYHEHPPYLAYVKTWQERNLRWQYILEGKVKKNWDDFLFVETELSHLPDFVIAGMKAPERVYLNASFNSFGNLTLATLDPLSEEHFNIMLRFARVFDLTYTRFNDLQKAEAQAKEAKIETALERIRARALAMHSSAELTEVASVLREQMRILGQIELEGCVVHLYEEDPDNIISWLAIRPDTTSVDRIVTATCIKIPKDSCELAKELVASFNNKNYEYTIISAGKKLRDWRNVLFNASPDLEKGLGGNIPEKNFIHCADFSGGSLIMVSLAEPSGESIYLQRRAANVFDLAYKRFVDLKKAEEQAREAQIETSLERVRSKTMAMHSSDDVTSATATMFTELEKLGIENLRCGITIINKNKTQEVWSVSNVGDVHADYSEGQNKIVTAAGTFDMNAHPLWRLIYDKWESKEDFVNYFLAGTDKEDYFKILNTTKGYLPHAIQHFPDTNFQVYFFGEGAVWSCSLQPHSDEDKQVMKRFTSVFSLTFRRYQDLKKAEAQAREAQIQLALERVRARTMAMHKSEELAEVAEVLYNQLKDLGDDPERITIGIMSEDNRVISWWATDQGGSKLDIRFQATADEPTVMLKLYNTWKAKHASLVVDLTGPELSQWVKYCREVIGVPINEEILQNRRVQTAGFFSHGCVMITSPHLPAAETINILERFATVFGLTYRRFLDLQKAEAQAREAQVEAALERVRSRSLAMHKSDELQEVVNTVFEKLKDLNIEMDSANIALFKESAKDFEYWIATPVQNRSAVFHMPYTGITRDVADAKESGAGFFTKTYSFKEKNELFQQSFQLTDFKFLDEYRKKFIMNAEGATVAIAFSKHTGVQIARYSLKSVDAADIDVLKRFSKVFEQAYIRFLDLQKAEVQAREATIEAALERVRGKAMAMHNSNDLSVTASMVFTELRKLGISPIRCGVGLLNKESRKALLYSATSSPEGDSLSLVGWVQLDKHPVLEKIYDEWLQQQDYFPELEGEQLRSYYQLLLEGLAVPAPDFINGQKQYGHFFSFSVGCLYAWSEIQYTEAEIKIFKRFASIVDLTFRRYLELQKSEAQAREAVKQAALDRIRADIASMRTVNDLDKITPLIWNELTILGLSFIRCGVFIMDAAQSLIHTFLSTPDGKAIAAFHLPYTTPGNIQKMLSHWQGGENYIDHWDESEFMQFAEILVEQKALSSAQEYLKTIPHDGFYLHFLPFLQGMLYVGNTTQLSEEEIALIQSVADAFSTAYARYEDFNKLEAAKQQVEKTLVDLKQAQQQLIQAEKMASLGELTAGIAHEIQNPLNFVNNFSEINGELIIELVDEVDKKNFDEVRSIAKDIKENEEKINHHGKRADAIVKGMLQHSRTSAGQKEPTDINTLCDEYLRLSYHGLRAKDKSFNAKIETGFDNSIGKINIIPQEIGRVLLNLINNAFYAVTQKQQYNLNGYEPTVTITTTKENGKVNITVKDNGNGIPQKNLDKIFQPFFTTKPTGQGTGLGLSLSYDIIKAHGGEIKVDTKDGAGTMFTIILPDNKL